MNSSGALEEAGEIEEPESPHFFDRPRRRDIASGRRRPNPAARAKLRSRMLLSTLFLPLHKNKPLG